LTDEVERGLQQGFAEIAVVIAALAALILVPVFAPVHVKGFYMSRAQKALAAHDDGRAVHKC
jgi:hypothetical protein